jgi:hypothetical protein
MPHLTLDEIRNIRDIKEKDLTVPGWDGTVRIKAFTLARRDYILDKARSKVNGDGKAGDIDGTQLQLLLVIYGMADPELTENDLPWLKEKCVEAIEFIAGEVMAINGMKREAPRAAEVAFPRQAGT